MCKAIRGAALKMYYGYNDFDVTLFLDEIGLLTTWLEILIAKCGTNPFGHFNFFIMQQFYHLEHMRPFVHLLYQTGLQLKGRPVDASKILPNTYAAYGNRVPKPESVYGVQILGMCSEQEEAEEVVGLSAKAREEGWDEDSLDEEFDRLVEGKLTAQEGAKAAMRWKAKQKKIRAAEVAQQAARKGEEDGA